MMRRKRLAAATIIPEDLYIERAADRQLVSTIEQMGRPGYVLVARQMGKTNLLLHARRVMEGEFLKFVYLDLSTQVSSLTEFYVGLFNTLIELHGSALGAQDLILSELLDNIRAAKLAPFQAFESNVRKILGIYPGRLVFVLDEVDSLIGSGFSDNLFSQIRSIYFATRANYPEFGRLTYVLSGVAEPSDLIQDKNVSPFNIGEKIYLSDFTEAEHQKFVDNSQLQVSNEVCERVFYWAHGNPRITWDVLSRVEDLVDAGGSVSVGDVDSVVETLYLQQFDRPPVDHIRNVVAGDRSLRRAISDLRADKPDAVSAGQRTRLYLAGILESPTEEGPPKIKNRVIERALSDTWLESVARRERDRLFVARELFRDQKYDEATQHFEAMLDPNDTRPDHISAYQLALCFFQTQKYTKAVEWFQRVLDGNPSEPIRSNVLYFSGISHLAQHEYSQAAINLRQSLENRHSSYRDIASANLAAALIASDVLGNKEEIIQLSQEIKELAVPSPGKPDSLTRTLAFANLYKVYLAIGSKEQAEAELVSALENAEPDFRPSLRLGYLQLLEDADRSRQVANALGTEIVTHKLQLVDLVDGTGLRLNEPTLFSALAAVYLFSDREIFERLFKYTHDVLFAGLRGQSLIFEEMGRAAPVTKVRDFQGRTDILLGLIERFKGEPGSEAVVFRAQRELLAYGRVRPEFIQAYLTMSTTPLQNKDVDLVDYLAAFNILSSETVLSDSDLLTRAVAHAEQLRNPSDIRLRSAFALILIRLMDFHANKGLLTIANDEAEQVLDLLQDETEKDTTFRLFPANIVNSLRETASNHLRRYGRHVAREAPMERSVLPHLGRNSWITVRYTTGKMVTKKYKFLQRDLALERCEIVEVLGDQRRP
jgi:tetratricopeptide (TPR) repeat protein